MRTKVLSPLVLLLSFCFSLLLYTHKLYAQTSSHTQAQAVAQDIVSEPHNIVQETTTKVLTVLEMGLDPVKEPKKFTQALSDILDPVIAFDYIARAVMGRYAKQVNKAQVEQFATAFKEGLVSTYGKGMVNFSDFDIAVLPPEKPLGDSRSVAVVQEVRGAAAATQISYSMKQNKKGQWKMVNMVLNGINLGQTFRGQFAAAVEKNKGDVAKTIDEWGKH